MLRYCCPQCKGPLDAAETAFHCPACARTYPVIAGIPDFRVYPDPYIDMESDRKKALYLLHHAPRSDFRGLVEFYWEITPEVPRHLVSKYIRYAMTGIDRGKATLRALRTQVGDHAGRHDAVVLELGCGTGGFLCAAAAAFDHVIGVDIAFRWLVIAQRRLAEQGLALPLVCCCAEYLPFSSDTCDIVVARDVIEHTRYQAQLLQESHRVLAPSGVLFVSTPNRFSLTPEPCVRVWGVGFLPRRLMPVYVKLVRGVPYHHVRLLSPFELKRMLRRAGFVNRRLRLPSLGQDEQRLFSRWEKAQVTLYHVLVYIPFLRAALLLCGPFFHAIGVVAKKSRGPPLKRVVRRSWIASAPGLVYADYPIRSLTG